MLEYFPTNYVWNLATNISLNTGGHFGEVHNICHRLIEVSKQGDDESSVAFYEAWSEQANTLIELAIEDLAAGHTLSAAAKYGRASNYYLTAERMLSQHFSQREEAYKRGIDYFVKQISLGNENCETVEVPYRGTSLPALFVKAEGVDGRKAPVVALFNGLDSFKEMIYGSGIAQQLAKRGISSIIVDQPGAGGAIRLKGLTAVVESELWAGAVVDYLETRPEVDSGKIGVTAWSLGGYYAPRAAAFEKRFKLCVAWGANHNWGEVQKQRQAREGANPVPHYWEHVKWVWGEESTESFMAMAPRVTLEGVVDKITVPFLVLHGSNDRQINIKYAHQSYEQAVNSPLRELKIFTEREGGVEHCSADNMSNARDYIVDWISDVFKEHVS
ncbi:alpha/beta hydrolase [Pseudomonas fluorescens]|jgi:dienelactone hydrolase|uniref:alpha/beta hydrolase family protein n=1 Tax=Pseudomonas fluorescens TaxID=294 RepID=UPI002ACAD555|nr:alpha/beta hydrolase [Pseudomonas fluorescens]MDZ5433261.1 alpha/beta hydrolase [Pseudomonas fluorescens]